MKVFQCHHELLHFWKACWRHFVRCRLEIRRFQKQETLSRSSSGLLYFFPWNLYTKSQNKLSSCFESSTNPSCLRKFDIERIHLRKTPYTSHVISSEWSIKQFSRHLSMKPREESVPGDKTDPLRMCYVQRTSNWLFLSSHPISGRSDNDSIRNQICFRTQDLPTSRH